MAIQDPFSYSDRWDSIGLDCSYCKYFLGPEKWPDMERVSSCKLHKISLSIELAENGFKEGEWFCKDFEKNADSKINPKSQIEFESLKKQLQPQKLYRAPGPWNLNKNLKEYDFKEFK